MNFSSSKNTQIILLVALIAALIFAVYYYLVLPKQSEVDALNRSIDTLNSEISTIQKQIGQVEPVEVKTSSPLSLRKKMPQTHEVDELLLNIEEIEYITDSHVRSISFNDYNSSVQDVGIGIQNEEADTELTATQESGASDTSVEDTDSENPEAPFNFGMDLPQELKLMSFNLEVQSPDYKRLLEFIDEIEKLERIMRIDSINYSLPGEEAEFVEEATTTVSASIQVTTFYYEGE